MKKNFKLLLFILIMIPVVAFANDEYVNYYGLVINEEEYNNLLGLGFSEDEIYYMSEEEFYANKDIESSLEAVETKYYVSTVRYDSLGRAVHSTNLEVTEDEYKDNSVALFSTTIVETTYKELKTTIAQAGTKYRYKVTLTWKRMPAVRSYDIIGIGIEEVLVYINSDLTFNLNYCISNTCYNTNEYHMDTYGTSGAGVNFQMPTSSSVTGIRTYFYFDVSKQNPDTVLTVQYADGDYSHAIRTVTAGQANGYYVNQSGIDLFDEVEDYYDTINAAEAAWGGSW